MKNIKSCPCCGETREFNGTEENGELFGLYAGPESCSSCSVLCYRTGSRKPR